jgi:hypothetical protein
MESELDLNLNQVFWVSPVFEEQITSLIPIMRKMMENMTKSETFENDPANLYRWLWRGIPKLISGLPIT